MPATEVNQLPVKRQLTLRYSRAATIMVLRYRDTDGTYLPIEVQAALATDWLDEGGTNVLDCTVTAVSNEGQEITVAAADWATAAVPFTDLKCEVVAKVSGGEWETVAVFDVEVVGHIVEPAPTEGP